MNKCVLIGNLSKEPEVSMTNNGIKVCKFSIAINRNYYNAAGVREVDFFNVVAWRTVAENCGKYLKKGSKVAITGRIENRSYEVNGQKRYTTEIIADEVEFLTSASREEQSESMQDRTSRVLKEAKELPDDGLPF